MHCVHSLQWLGTSTSVFELCIRRKERRNEFTSIEEIQRAFRGGMGHLPTHQALGHSLVMRHSTNHARCENALHAPSVCQYPLMHYSGRILSIRSTSAKYNMTAFTWESSGHPFRDYMSEPQEARSIVEICRCWHVMITHFGAPTTQHLESESAQFKSMTRLRPDAFRSTPA